MTDRPDVDTQLPAGEKAAATAPATEGTPTPISESQAPAGTDRPDVDTPQASYDDLERLVASVGTTDEWRAFVRLLREAGYEIRPTGIGRREARDDG